MRHHLRLRGSLLTVFVMLLALLPAVTATATTGVMYVTADTTLAEDHYGPIEITADDVTLDCAGYRVIGSGTGDGIEVQGRSGVTVRNCEVSGFGQGIVLNTSTGSTIDGNHVHDNVGVDFSVGNGSGITLWNSPDNAIINNVAARNGVDGIYIGGDDSTSNRVAGNTASGHDPGAGISVDRCDGNLISDNDLRENGVGLGVWFNENNTVADNEASDNSGHGFMMWGAQDNSFAGNLATGNAESGFGVRNGGPNSFTDNDSHMNGEWGFESFGNSGLVTFTENRCVDNVLGGSDPSGLCDESGHFTDDDGTTFELDIEWMAREGITRGCNPPTNDLFCPDSSVSRGQMAAFLTRALELPAASSAGFVDTVGSTFETDIDRLAAAGITRGCNPPVNDRFCPDDPVRREVMAAFLVRALGYTDDGSGDLFTDDDGSIFESDIDKLATAGVTRGCNPPTNDRFCPTSNVTRGQMAAFLHRALG